MSKTLYSATRLELEGVTLPENILNQTIELLTAHESVRGFLPKPLPNGMLEAITTAARSAPTSSNLQAIASSSFKMNNAKVN